MYGFSGKVDRVDKARKLTFDKTYKAKDKNEILKLNADKMDGSAFPPCSSELQMHLRRTLYIASLWRHCHLPQPSEVSPLDYGWEECENQLTFKWFDGRQLPESVADITINDDERESSEMEDDDSFSDVMSDESSDEEDLLDDEDLYDEVSGDETDSSLISLS